MRLRRVPGASDSVDRNSGHRHEAAFVTLIKDYGLLHEAELLPRSYGGDSWFGKFHPNAGKELLDSLPVVVYGLDRKSTRLNSSHANISYAVFCLKKKQH